MLHSDPVHVPRSFPDDFELVASHYGFTDDERDEARAVVRGDTEAGVACFTDIAARIRRETPGESAIPDGAVFTLADMVIQKTEKPKGRR